MIGIKGMVMPKHCWDCELTHDNTSGMTVCDLTGKALYPMNTKNTRPDECPLVEIDIVVGSDMDAFEKIVDAALESHEMNESEEVALDGKTN